MSCFFFFYFFYQLTSLFVLSVLEKRNYRWTWHILRRLFMNCLWTREHFYLMSYLWSVFEPWNISSCEQRTKTTVMFELNHINVSSALKSCVIFAFGFFLWPSNNVRLFHGNRLTFYVHAFMICTAFFF